MDRAAKQYARLAAVLALTQCLIGGAQAQSIEELRNMSIRDLARFDVSSVTKTSEALADAPAAIYMITHDDIVRSGNTTLSGILRLAPNLEVMRGGAGGLVVTARGLNGNPDAQNFSNKLLVLIDGRSVYTPLYSGVYWDMQDLLPEDIDRIEVISGPGATLWGANAVNGVINVITRPAGRTQGAYATAVVGNNTRDAGIRYGGRIGEALSYRLYAKAHRNLDSDSSTDDDQRRVQGGFRIDWTADDDRLMVQGDGYDGSRAQQGAPRETIKGHDILARWNRETEGSSLQVQAYYDNAGRETRDGGGQFTVDTFDLDIQHSLAIGAAHQFVWGGGARTNRYEIEGTPNLFFDPAGRTLFLANVFAQDSIALTPGLTAIVGLKLERDPYSGLVLLPSGRLSGKVADNLLLWGAVSRAIRSPTPFDSDVVEKVGPTTFLTGSPDFRTEKLTAYEAGSRLIAASSASLSVSAFYNVYDDLRSIEITPSTFLPLLWGNGIKGHSYGFDSWADLRITDWWRLKPGYSFLIERFRFKPGASGVSGVSQVGNDPKHRFTLRTSMDLGPRVNFDADLRYVSALPDPRVPGYVELGARIGYMVSERAELSVSGFNLLHKRHYELPSTQANAVPRSLFVALKWHL